MMLKGKIYKVATIGMVLLAGISFAGCSSSSNSNSSSSSSSSVKKVDPLSKVYKVGQTASYKGYKIKVNSVQFSQGDEYNTPDSGKQYVIANVTITNDTNETQSYNPYYFKLNENGNGTDMDEIVTNVDNVLHSGELDKGASVTGNLVGQADPNANKLQLQYKTSYFNDKTVKFDLKSGQQSQNSIATTSTQNTDQTSSSQQ